MFNKMLQGWLERSAEREATRLANEEAEGLEEIQIFQTENLGGLPSYLGDVRSHPWAAE